MSTPPAPRPRRLLPTRPGAPPRATAILVVENELDGGECLREVLRAEGYQVALAVGLAAAERLLPAGRFAVVLADSLRASTTGRLGDRWSALERVRTLAGATPVVLTTAYPPHLFGDYRARGFAALVGKPFDLDDLLATVARLRA